jgi:hypothetical protein
MPALIDADGILLNILIGVYEAFGSGYHGWGWPTCSRESSKASVQHFAYSTTATSSLPISNRVPKGEDISLMRFTTSGNCEGGVKSGGPFP